MSHRLHYCVVIMKLVLQSTTGKWDTSTKSDTSKAPLNLLEIHEIGSVDLVDTSESKQQNYDQI